ncbi:MAG: hypothetical protein JXA25_10460 [Anaerolineales bacterium]|nr:hypothetical protein [Anaerolineales bacterium]
MKLKSEVIRLLDRGYELENAFARELPEGERENPGSFSAWSGRDVLNHSAFWILHTANNLERILSGQKAEWIEDYNHQNELVYQQHNQDDWETVLSHVSTASDRLLEETGKLSEEQLLNPQYLQQEHERPAWQHILGSGYLHVVMHLADYWIKHGREELAREVYREMSEAIAPLDENPVWQGTVLYNQACIEALTGQEQDALELLTHAFSLHPGLKEWSQQDTDMVSLHDLPVFKKLVE